MAEQHLQVVALDINETLFSLDGLGPAFAAVGLDPASVRCGSPGCCATASL